MSDNGRLASLEQAREILKNARTGSLSVLDYDSGGPHGALVNVAMTAQFCPIILTSKLSRHTQCLDHDSRASVMVTGRLPQEGDPLTGFRATLTGTFSRIDDSAVRQRFLDHHPYAELYADFSDFGFWIMATSKLYVVAGFGRVYNFDAKEM